MLTEHFDWIEIWAKKGTDPSYLVAKLYPSYKRAYVCHKFLWFRWVTFECTNMPQANWSVYERALTKVHEHMASSGANIVSIWTIVGSEDYNTATWQSEFYNE